MDVAAPTTLPIDAGFVRETLERLVRINSVNPSLVPGAPGETEIAVYVVGCLHKIGLTVDVHEPQPGRPSVLGRLPGSGSGRSLMLNAHLDTVDIQGMQDPLSGSVQDGRLYGRGAYDMKGSLAACLGAAKALVDSGVRLRGDLFVAAVADEEYGSLGTADLLTRVRPDAAIVTEPTALQICLAHKGYLWIEVVVSGRAAHGSRFELGIDANLKMGKFLARLDDLERDLRSRAPHALVGPPSLHAALLNGGSGLSTYAAWSKVQIERRTVPGETESQAVREIQAIVDALSAQDPDFRAEVRPFFSRDPFEVVPSAGIVEGLDRCATSRLGAPPRQMGDTPWMDAALLQAAGVETVVFGPRGAGAHADVEWVELESVNQLAGILADVAVDYCK